MSFAVYWVSGIYKNSITSLEGPFDGFRANADSMHEPHPMLNAGEGDEGML